MKILIVNTVYEGASTGKIAMGLYRRLVEDGHQCMFISRNKKKGDSSFVQCSNKLNMALYLVMNQITGVHGYGAIFTNKQIERCIDDFKPDIVQLYNLHGYYLNIYRLFEYLKKKKIPVVYGMLDEHPYLGYCAYAYDCKQFKTGCKKCDWKRFRHEYPINLLVNGTRKTLELKEKAYQDFEKLVFTAPEWVIGRAKESYLLRDKKLIVLDEYVDTETTFVPRDASDIRKQMGISDEQIIILNVAPSSDKRKGVKYYIELAKRMEEDKRYVFVHVGWTGDESQLPSNYIPISFVRNQELLAKYYSMADMFVCTSLADTMPNVCLDAMACGTPVLGFNITGVPYVAGQPIGEFVDVGDLNALESIIRKKGKKSDQMQKLCREYAVQRYSLNTYYAKTMKIYKELLNER